MSKAFDLIIIGAGPGGLAAAATASDSGLRVCLVDDNPSAGGQIWRTRAGDGPAKGAQRWLHSVDMAKVDQRFGWRAVFSPAPGVLRIEQSERFADLEFAALVLATGARELFLPFPGWTLPGVYGAGGLQAFVKSGFSVRGKRIVVAGTGPLLPAVAAHLRQTGANIVSVVEQAPFQRLLWFSAGLLAREPGKLLEGAGYALRLAGIPYRTGAWVMRAHGGERLEKVTILSGLNVFDLETDMLALGYHLVPNAELPLLLGCDLDRGYVRVDELQQTSVKGIYCVGESTGIGGVDKALIEGRIAGLAAAKKFDEARILFAARDRQMRFARGLADAFALREELRHLPDDNTLFCRCEDIPYCELAKCSSWREAKLHTRCGMGPCQGRICGAASEFLWKWKVPAPRPPLFPVEIATLAAAAESAPVRED
jgi:D-hydroxyproline dehydrogenase subunit alpha